MLLLVLAVSLAETKRCNGIIRSWYSSSRQHASTSVLFIRRGSSRDTPLYDSENAPYHEREAAILARTGVRYGQAAFARRHSALRLPPVLPNDEKQRGGAANIEAIALSKQATEPILVCF